MKKICLCFQIHQPYRLRRYRFFDIGNEHHYCDDFQNEDIFSRIADTCYLPANRVLLELLREHPELRVSFSISGLAIEQMEYYRPQILESFKELVATGRVELLAETYAHSLTGLYDPVEFRSQVKMQQDKLRALFGVKPSKVLCNTELIYTDELANEAKAMGFEGILTEGAKHVLGWKSPNYLYSAATEPSIKLLLRNPGLSDMISRDFSRYDTPDYPITADKVISRVSWLPEEEDFTVLYMNYEVLGSMHRAESGIFDFMRALPLLASREGISFATPSELVASHKPVGVLSVPYPISSSGEEKGTTEWTGNILQQGAIEKLLAWGERVRAITEDHKILEDWLYLQSADHFYYMNTVNWGGGGFSPYSSPYDAFNNYMNVLSDFLIRVEKIAPKTIEVEELNSYQQTIQNQNLRIKELEQELAALHSKKRTSAKK